jgi:hypothetical protein
VALAGPAPCRSLSLNTGPQPRHQCLVAFFVYAFRGTPGDPSQQLSEILPELPIGLTFCFRSFGVPPVLCDGQLDTLDRYSARREACTVHSASQDIGKPSPAWSSHNSVGFLWICHGVVVLQPSPSTVHGAYRPFFPPTSLGSLQPPTPDFMLPAITACPALHTSAGNPIAPPCVTAGDGLR